MYLLREMPEGMRHGCPGVGGTQQPGMYPMWGLYQRMSARGDLQQYAEAKKIIGKRGTPLRRRTSLLRKHLCSS